MCFRFRSFPFRFAFFRPLYFRFRLLSLCFFLSSFFPSSSHSDLSGAASLPFGFLAFPLPLHPVSCASLPLLRTRLSVCFLSSFPVSLPQLLSRCFPYAPFPFVHFAFGLSPRSAFFRPLSLGSDYSAFRLSFPFFPFPLSAVPSVLSVRLAAHSLFLFHSDCFHSVFPIRYSAYCSSFLHPLSRPTVATSAPRPPFRARPRPPLLSLRVSVTRLSVHSLSAAFCCCLRDSLIMIPQQLVIVNNFFKIFLYIFTILSFGQIRYFHRSIFVQYVYNFSDLYLLCIHYS